MPPRLSWSKLLPGLIGLAIVVAIAAGVMLFAGAGLFSADTIRLYVLTNQAQGVLGGTEVWLVGQKIGHVEGIGFRVPTNDTAARVVLELKVNKADAGQIRRDSDAQIRTAGTVIGAPVVYISAGTPGIPPARDGDTLRAHAQSDVALASAKLGEALDNLRPIMADTRTIMARLRGDRLNARGPRVEQHNGEVAELRELRSHVSRIRDRFSTRTSGVMRAAKLALARADSVRGLLDSDSTSLGRFRRDSTLGATIARVRDELGEVRARMESVHGNVGRLSQDSAVTRALADAQREMGLLFDDVRRRPSRYITPALP